MQVANKKKTWPITSFLFFFEETKNMNPFMGILDNFNKKKCKNLKKRKYIGKLPLSLVFFFPFYKFKI